MANADRSYLVRDAGTRSRPGKVQETHPYTLRGLLAAIDAARFRSYGDRAVLVVVAEGRRRRTIRRFEDGREVAAESPGS